MSAQLAARVVSQVKISVLDRALSTGDEVRRCSKIEWWVQAREPQGPRGKGMSVY